MENSYSMENKIEKKKINKIEKKKINKIEKKKINKNKGLITSSISTLFKKKENFSNIRAYYPSNVFPSYKILLKLVSEMWDNPQLEGFKLLKRYNKLAFYQSIKNEKNIVVGMQDTDPASLKDVTTAFKNIFFKTDLRKLKRYQNDLQNMIEFQKDYPMDEYYYMATGISIAGAIIDLFLEAGYIHEAVTFNAVIEDRFMNRSEIKNYRIYLNEDVFYLGMGMYACNTKVLNINPDKKLFLNPINEMKYLYKLHTMNNMRSSSLAHLKKILSKEEKKTNKKNK